MTSLHPTIDQVTQRIIERSRLSRDDYLDRMQLAIANGVQRSNLTCGNMAHACAAASLKEKTLYAADQAINIGIVTAYNDMLSAHQPFQEFPDLIKETAMQLGATAQVAGGVPAMCDGVTQGQSGMELSLFSRDVITMAAAVALSHQCFDSVVYLGVCDKIIPGLTMAAASFGHLPAMMLPAGPMPSGLPNEEKASVRQKHAAGEASQKELLQAEMSSYHSPGTCTFYGTANTNQLIMEIMGLHLPGGSFVNPNTPLRKALTRFGVQRSVLLAHGQDEFTPAFEILTEKNFVNGLVGLLASGGSTNLVIHMVAMARAAGIIIDLQDFSDLSAAVPTISRVYPNGWADVNSFQQAGGMPVFIAELLNSGYLHNDVKRVMGEGLSAYTLTPELDEKQQLHWVQKALKSTQKDVLTSTTEPFSATGGLVLLEGNIGRAVIKTSALKPEHYVIKAPAKVFHTQEQVKQAFAAGELDTNFICVVNFQGPQANGMPELHGLTPILSTIQARGFQVALVTDGRMSGASGKVPSAIHVSPEAAMGGPLAKVQDGDILRVDATNGVLENLSTDFQDRPLAQTDLSGNSFGMGRELFEVFRQWLGPASEGASSIT